MKHPWSPRVSVYCFFFHFSSNYTAERCFKLMSEAKVKALKGLFQALQLHIITLIAISEVCVKIKTVFNTKNLVWYLVRSAIQSLFSTSTHSPEETLLHMHQDELWSPLQPQPVWPIQSESCFYLSQFTSLLALLPSKQRCIHKDLNPLEGIKSTHSK